MHGGEFMRELALLIVVFYPLDVYGDAGRDYVRHVCNSVDDRSYIRRGVRH